MADNKKAFDLAIALTKEYCRGSGGCQNSPSSVLRELYRAIKEIQDDAGGCEISMDDMNPV